MIQGEVLQELIPYKRYKVRIMNNKPLKTDIEKTLDEEKIKVQQALDEVQKKYNEYDGGSKILFLQSDIETLEQQEQTLSVLHKINRLERQIFNHRVIMGQFERTFSKIAQEERNVQHQINLLSWEPDFFDFDVWCSQYRKWNVGDTVPLVSNGYDIRDWVILPEWEFNLEGAGFGNALTSKRLLETYEWVYSQIKLNENVYKDIVPYIKATVVFRKDDYINIELDLAPIWDMGIVKIQRTGLSYSPSARYQDGAFLPYSEGDKVLVKFTGKYDCEIIGFWQEPVKPFNLGNLFSYSKQLTIEESMDEEDASISASHNFGKEIHYFNETPLIKTKTTRSFANLNIENNAGDLIRCFVGMTDNYPEPDVLHQSKDNSESSEKFFNFFNKHNRSYNSAILPYAYNRFNADDSFVGDINILNDGVKNGGYIKTSLSNGYSKPYIKFHTNQIMWNNVIRKIDNNYNCTVRSGVIYTPPPINLIELYREDGTKKIANFYDSEIQSYITRFLNNRDNIYQSNLNSLQTLFNPRSGLYFNNYYDFFNDCLNSSGFFTQEIVDSLIIEQNINLKNILQSFVLDNVSNTNNFATNFYYGFSRPTVNISNEDAVNLFYEYKKPPHSIIENGVILKKNQANFQNEDWYITNVNKINNWATINPDTYLQKYEKVLSFDYQKITYIE